MVLIPIQPIAFSGAWSSWAEAEGAVQAETQIRKGGSEDLPQDSKYISVLPLTALQEQQGLESLNPSSPLSLT